MEGLRREVLGMRQTLSRLQQGRTVDVIRDELVQYAKRLLEVLDPRRALALMETLVTQARREGHPKLEESLVIVETATPHAGEYYFKGLLIDQFGSGVVKKSRHRD
ncbi:Hypp3520 [Branchiostoma lanceolatum]|uniref:Hypp3520 protein n=1 Tax=Branchiostoma lanceolatum TaxID=7740 RepID=A0A8K0A0G8_BRALA|nr:Hypp3520 [Branchiostoma lanceolatum]